MCSWATGAVPQFAHRHAVSKLAGDLMLSAQEHPLQLRARRSASQQTLSSVQNCKKVHASAKSWLAAWAHTVKGPIRVGSTGSKINLSAILRTRGENRQVLQTATGTMRMPGTKLCPVNAHDAHPPPTPMQPAPVCQIAHHRAASRKRPRCLKSEQRRRGQTRGCRSKRVRTRKEARARRGGGEATTGRQG